MNEQKIYIWMDIQISFHFFFIKFSRSSILFCSGSSLIKKFLKKKIKIQSIFQLVLKVDHPSHYKKYCAGRDQFFHFFLLIFKFIDLKIESDKKIITKNLLKIYLSTRHANILIKKLHNFAQHSTFQTYLLNIRLINGMLR